MKLTVILPCFNGAETIEVQMEALTRQHWPDGWEVVVVNNGSTDRSMEIVEQYRDRLPSLRIVQAHEPGTTRLGVPHSYNTGVKAATGEAFVLCEADDEVADGWLEAMGKALSQHDFVVARLDYRQLNDESIQPPYENGEGFQSRGLVTFRWADHVIAASLCGAGLRRSMVEKVGPLSISFPIVHDAEYCWRAQLAGYTPHFEPEAVVHYRLRASARGRFIQGRNWGRDTTRLEWHYVGRKSFPAVRHLAWMASYVPRVIKPLALLPFRPIRARQLLSEWIWQFGWSVGKLSAILRRPTARPATSQVQTVSAD